MFKNNPVAFSLWKLKLTEHKLHYALKSHQANTRISKYIHQVYLQRMTNQNIL